MNCCLYFGIKKQFPAYLILKAKVIKLGIDAYTEALWHKGNAEDKLRPLCLGIFVATPFIKLNDIGH